MVPARPDSSGPQIHHPPPLRHVLNSDALGLLFSSVPGLGGQPSICIMVGASLDTLKRRMARSYLLERKRIRKQCPGPVGARPRPLAGSSICTSCLGRWALAPKAPSPCTQVRLLLTTVVEHSARHPGTKPMSRIAEVSKVGIFKGDFKVHLAHTAPPEDVQTTMNASTRTKLTVQPREQKLIATKQCMTSREH